MPEGLTTLIGLAAGLAAFGLVRLLRRSRKWIFIPDYKRGVRFVKGAFVDVLGPGVYEAVGRSEAIEQVDMRPQPILLDKTTFRDGMQNTAIVSIGGQLQVSDPYLAVTMIKDQVNDSRSLIRNVLRTILSRGLVDRSASARAHAIAEITAAINEELARVGIKISSLEILELWSQAEMDHGSMISH